MTKQDVLESIALKKRFCKDCSIPMSVYDNPYFYNRLLVMDRVFDCLQRFEQFCGEFEHFCSEQEYFEEYNRIKDSMITAIKENDTYREFNNCIVPKKLTSIGKKNLYVDQNDNGMFISIDMKQANFSALRHYSPDIFAGEETWESFVGRYTNIKHIIQSKYIRQVVLGALNPRHQIQYETYLMSVLCEHIARELDDSNCEIYSLAEDEILIETKKYDPGLIEKIREIVRACDKGIGSLVRVELFTLQKVKEYGWLKVDLELDNFDKKKVSFKCFDADIIIQIIKHFFMLPIKEEDLVFYHNGRLARFLNEVEHPWNI